MQIKKYPRLSVIHLLAVVVFTFWFVTSASAQLPGATPTPLPSPTMEVSGIARTEKYIPVPQPKPDKEIVKRLTQIFNLTGWFEALRVTSQDGIVTLYGTVAQASQRDWAVGLAKDTDGVVAVINKIELVQLGWFDLTSTQDELKTLWKSFFAFIPLLSIGLVILALAFVLYHFFSKLNKRFWADRIQNPILSDVVGKLGALPVLLIGFYLVLQVWGLTGLAVTLLGGTGALGLVAGFAFKNILENYFSGVMLSIRKPFVIGDQIEVADEKGIVFKMTTRGTTLVDADGKHVLIPNSTVFTSIIRNQSAGALSRIRMTFEAKSGSIEAQKNELIKYLRSRGDIVKTPEVEVFTTGTADRPSLEAYFWVEPKKTDVEKLRNVLASDFRTPRSGPTDFQPKGKTNDTASEIQAVLARASLAEPSDPKEKHL